LGEQEYRTGEWCQEQGWGFCCYDVRGFGDSEGAFTDYTLSDWMEDARTVLRTIVSGPPVTIVGNSLGGWIAWFMAQEFEQVKRLILIAPAFNMMGVRARAISDERRHDWPSAGWMSWDDDPAHKDWPLSWKWVEESEAHWKASFDRFRHVKTTILRGLQDTVILPSGSKEFVEQLLSRDPVFPVELDLIPGDHRLSRREHVERLHQLVLEIP
jgi:pimeloyl-ACP methyl ester carboxylesterase